MQIVGKCRAATRWYMPHIVNTELNAHSDSHTHIHIRRRLIHIKMEIDIIWCFYIAIFDPKCRFTAIIFTFSAVRRMCVQRFNTVICILYLRSSLAYLVIRNRDCISNSIHSVCVGAVYVAHITLNWISWWVWAGRFYNIFNIFIWIPKISRTILRLSLLSHHSLALPPLSLFLLLSRNFLFLLSSWRRIGKENEWNAKLIQCMTIGMKSEPKT